MIHVLATIELAPGRRSEFLREFHAIMPSVKSETGCLEYGPAVDTATQIAAQGPARPDVVVVVEKWASLPALEKHLAATHMLKYREKVKHLVQSVHLQILEPA
jgi:quinol monooxygenase YgiN